MAKAAKKGNSSKKSARKPKQKRAESEGDHLRTLAPASAVRSYIKECIASKNATSEEGQRLSTATRRATEQGVNVPMARVCSRLYNKAVQDPLKGRVNWEDLVYYMLECTDFNKIAPQGMFTAEESGQKRSHKKKQPVQTELPVGEPVDPMQAQSQAEPEPLVTH